MLQALVAEGYLQCDGSHGAGPPPRHHTVKHDIAMPELSFVETKLEEGSNVHDVDATTSISETLC